jgi:hypothetical protein
MALSKKEKELVEHMTLVFKNELNCAMKDLNTSVGEFTQTLYGVNRDNGLVGDCKTMKGKIADIELVHARQTGMIAAISAVVTILGISGRELIKAVFGK